MFCTTQWMQRHTTCHLAEKIRRFSAGTRWLGGRSLHTTRSIAQMFVGFVFKSRLMCMVFVADLITCRLNIFLSAVACRPVTPRLWGGFLVWLL
jgi:hypothetical protein